MRRLRFLAMGLGVSVAVVCSAALASPTSLRTNAVETPRPLTAFAADAGRVAFQTNVPSRARKCSRVLTWMAGARATSDPRQACGEIHPDTLAGNRLLWSTYEYGNQPYCEAVYTALLPRPKRKAIFRCTGDPDELLDTFGSGKLAVFAHYYYYCDVPDVPCTDDQGNAVPQGEDYDYEVYRVTRGKPVRILAPADNRSILGVNEGRILMWETDGSLAVYDENGTKLTSVALDPGAHLRDAILSGSLLAVLEGPGGMLKVYDASTGALQTTLSVTPTSACCLVAAGAGFVAYTGSVPSPYPSRANTLAAVRLSDGRSVVLRRFRCKCGRKGDTYLVGAAAVKRGLAYGYNRAVAKPPHWYDNPPERGELVFLAWSQIARKFP